MQPSEALRLSEAAPSADASFHASHESAFQAFKREVSDHPIAAGLATVTGTVLAVGAVRLGFGPRLAQSAKTETLSLTHLTSPAGAAGIAQTQKIGGKWGVFVLDSDKVPSSEFGRAAKSLVLSDLTHEVRFKADSNIFKAPLPVGPFSAARNLAGVRSAPLGSLDFKTKSFIPDEIFSGGAFRPSSAAERAKFKAHQFILDYGIDAEIWGAAAFGVYAIEDDAAREKHLREFKRLWQPVSR